MEDKKILRKEILARRDLLTWDEISRFSEKIAERLFGLTEYAKAQTILYFLNFGKEVQTLPMARVTLSHGKRVIAPKTIHKDRRMILSEIYDVDNDLAPGFCDIPEPRPDSLRPIDAGEIDFIIVPGVGFDEKGNRMGYGGGYYDRFFTELDPCVPLVALAFELQIVPKIPVSPWDRRIGIIITEKRVIDCRT